MFFNKHILILCLGFLAACGSVKDDLNPSAHDQRAAVVPHSIGSQPGQIIAPFASIDSNNNVFHLSNYLVGGATPADAIVLYFTMWCPVCMGHSDHILHTILPQFQQRGNILYAIVDYVSGTVSSSKASEMANGYNGSPFTILADNTQSIFHGLNASMGTVIVVDNAGNIHMNEDYKTGSKLSNTLNNILP